MATRAAGRERYRWLLLLVAAAMLVAWLVAGGGQEPEPARRRPAADLGRRRLAVAPAHRDRHPDRRPAATPAEHRPGERAAVRRRWPTCRRGGADAST